MYQTTYSEESLRQLLAIRPASQRERVLQQIQMLTNNPFAEGQFEVKDNAGRKNQVLVWESWGCYFLG